MPAGDKLDSKFLGVARSAYLYKLLELVATTNDGFWIDINDFDKGTIEFYNEAAVGSFTFTAKIMVSMAVNKPANNIDGIQVGNDVSALGLVAFSTPARWLKVKITALSPTDEGKLGCRFKAFSF